MSIGSEQSENASHWVIDIGSLTETGPGLKFTGKSDSEHPPKSSASQDSKTPEVEANWHVYGVVTCVIHASNRW